MVIASASCPDERSKHLLAILATPPLATSGLRTKRRIEMATSLLGCGGHEIANLLDVATNNVVEVNAIGLNPDAWKFSRPALAGGIARADVALLAWGHSSPNGLARTHHRAQVEWVLHELRERSIPLWAVGPTPRHPSRWQRYTSREFPNLPFSAALGSALARF